jgi:GTPase involved in cell partitioning and DNA repair
MSLFIPPATPIFIHSLDTGKEVKAQYNPKELQIDKTVPWQKHNKSGASGLQMEYTGAEGRDMTLELMFDGAEEAESVRGIVADLEDMATEKLQSKDNTRRPDHCFVAWGEIMGGGTNKFMCVIIQISTKYTMFSPGGEALRAVVTLKLKEASEVFMGSGGGS